jgi:hypothetical protein
MWFYKSNNAVGGMKRYCIVPYMGKEKGETKLTAKHTSKRNKWHFGISPIPKMSSKRPDTYIQTKLPSLSNTQTLSRLYLSHVLPIQDVYCRFLIPHPF